MAKKLKYKFITEVWIYPSEHASWHFVSLSKKDSVQIRKDFKEMTRGWGSLPVSVSLGKSVWKTSIFPHKKEEVYILPIKASVRAKEAILSGSSVKIDLEIMA